MLSYTREQAEAIQAGLQKRGLQSGQVQWYAYVFLIGTLALTILIVFC